MYIRGTTMAPYICRPVGDISWTDLDYARAMTWEARLSCLNIPEEERRELVLCAVMIRKFPGIQYPEEIMKTLRSVSVNGSLT